MTLGLDTPENAPHRAEVRTLLVDPAARRRGVGRALMRRAEQAARGIGRSLLTLDTRVGTAAAALYRGLGWTEACVIPAYEVGPDRRPADVVFFWKAVAPMRAEGGA